MTSKVQVLAPIFVDWKIVTSGVVHLDNETAAQYDKEGKVDVLEVDGEVVMWPGCCQHH